MMCDSPRMSAPSPKISVRGLSAWYRDHRVLKDIDIDIEAEGVTAVIGPPGCGKSTFVRCLNRMHELVPGARMGGRIRIDGEDILALEPASLRRRVGMIFNKPNPFPNMSIRENVLAGLQLTGRRPEGSAADETVERALRRVELWAELRGRLDDPPAILSSGDQQRLCVARTLAVEPEILLLDEPCSVLDPVATAKIEDLLHVLRERYTVVIVTHNIQQAARVAERTGFFLAGELIEYADTDAMFTAPVDKRTEDYITGKFG